MQIVLLGAGKGTRLKPYTNKVPKCMVKLTYVEVHGHYQCIACKGVISECCSGETAENE